RRPFASPRSASCWWNPSAWRVRVRQSEASSSQHPGFVLELRNQLSDVLDLDASLAARWLRGLEDFEMRGEIDTVIGRALFGDRLLLGLHDVGKAGVARLVRPQIGSDDRRSLQLDSLQAAIDLARHLEIRTVDFELGGKGRLRPPEQGRQHLAGLVGIVVA